MVLQLFFWRDAWYADNDLATRYMYLLNHVKNFEVRVRHVKEDGIASMLVSRLTDLEEINALVYSISLVDEPSVRQCSLAQQSSIEGTIFRLVGRKRKKMQCKVNLLTKRIDVR